MIQKHILLIQNLTTEKAQKQIEEILANEGIAHEVYLKSKSVVVFSRGDTLAQAKRLMQKNGFEIL
ncbi:MAG: hypothetical protein ACK5KR_06970 [Breznakia sp.]